MVSPPTPDPVRLTAWVHGRVQGVGMRWWMRARAVELGLAGWARNTQDGRVEVVAEGERAAAQALLDLLRGPNSAVAGAGRGRPGRVDTVVDRWAPAQGDLSGFVER